MQFTQTMRTDGYAAIADYALIGDGRTAALVANDGAIDWLCLPNIDSCSVLGALLDADRGGSFTLRPSGRYGATRRYLPDTNVLETIYRTDSGVVQVVDALTLPRAGGLEPARELARAVAGLSGDVPMEWTCAPRFDYGARVPCAEWRGSVPVATNGSEVVAVRSWNAGSPAWQDGTVGATFTAREGDRALLSLAYATDEPLVFASRADIERRLDATVGFWRAWTAERGYSGPFRDEVLRSALVLKLLIFAPSGASSAAPTTSLPEQIGGVRNWDYRFCWIRDSNFLIDALLGLGCHAEAQALFWWFLQATARTEPELHVLYRLDGGLGTAERDLPLGGYRGSRPVRIGNRAVEQVQLDVYGDLLQTAWLFSRGRQRLDRDTGAVLARIADHVCDIWREPDSGIWEVRNGPFQFTHSKVMCWVALDRAAKLASSGELPSRHAARWAREAQAIRAFVDEKCWSDRLHSYTRTAGTEALDASLLMLPLVGFDDPRSVRIAGTVDAISTHLRHGDFVYRYRAADGLPGNEGFFLNCSFWLVSALARVGRTEDAWRLMESLVHRANDLGLYSEEIDGASGAFLGNFPQALVHLALIDAAMALGEAATRAHASPQGAERAATASAEAGPAGARRT